MVGEKSGKDEISPGMSASLPHSSCTLARDVIHIILARGVLPITRRPVKKALPVNLHISGAC